MAKRFIDTGIFDDPWFMELSKDGKITWFYLITKCDHAGIIQINEKLFKVQTGVNSWSTVHEELGNRCQRVRDNYYFIPKFIYFQYPGFPKSGVNQQSGAIKRLIEFNLFDGKNLRVDEELMKSSGTLHEDLTKSYGNVNGNVNVNVLEKEGVGEKTKKIPTLHETIEYFAEKGYSKEAAEKFWNYYDSGKWKDSKGKPVLSWRQKAQSVWFTPENRQEKKSTSLNRRLTREEVFGEQHA